jgi:hypothetical protein
MADITPDMFSSDIQALPNFQALLDRFRASPRLVQDIIDFTKDGKGRIELGDHFINAYHPPKIGQAGTIELNPSELGSPDLGDRHRDLPAADAAQPPAAAALARERARAGEVKGANET